MNGTSDPKAAPAAAPAPLSWSGSVTVRLSPREAWDLMWRPEGQSRWLGPQARVQLKSDGRWTLADDAGVWRTARCVKVKAPSSVTILIDAPPSWRLDHETRATIRVTPHKDAGSVIAIEESDIPGARREEAERFWRERLERLADLAGRVNARRREVRQAVVVIHGIGEQQPGETLKSLARSGVLASDDDVAQAMWVKPDYFSDSYELRRITLKATDARPTTDVFECYWAHIIRDTTLAQVGSWVRQLLWRWPVPAPLRPWWLLAWGLIVMAVAAAIASLSGVELAGWLALGSVALAAAGALWRFLGEPLAINFIGDAARYLRPHPANIANRQAIREAGVSLVEKLHASGRYDRIVLLGHSLGSVIAYDIITHAWTRMHTAHQRPSTPSFTDVIAVERALHSAPGTTGKTSQRLQHDAWRRLRANTQPWLITDLVTVGSPLTYADFLVADSIGAFEQAKSDRVLPTCPPTTEIEPKSGHERMTFDLPYTEPVSRDTRTFVVFHHGAPFAVTRWTNLYFKTRRLGLAGDIIGGPVAAQMGRWVRDVALPSPGPGFTHTWYWRRSGRGNKHLKALRGALRLDARAELLALLRESPAFTLLNEPDVPPGR